MSENNRFAAVGFHGGELAVQQRAGVQAQAARLSGMLEPAELRAGVLAFLAERTFAVITALGETGRLWTSPLTGQPGFLTATSPTTLAVGAAPPHGDPLHRLPPGQPVGMIVIDFAARRRVRINGTLTHADDGQLAIDVHQAYGNCPQYIQQRLVVPEVPDVPEVADIAGAGGVQRATALGPDDAELIRRADTFFLGTTHPGRGRDASHRGGPPGFVRVDGNGLWWPDYPGNNMFNSFGNLAVDPTAALLFVDFPTGHTVHLSGTAAVEWSTDGAPGDDGHTGRRARFTIESLASGPLLAARETAHTGYPHNPPITD
ncbi:MAG: pyridoxamine 5'-phosphate oxidase family protein [Mycobacteriaceae bacterium]